MRRRTVLGIASFGAAIAMVARRLLRRRGRRPIRAIGARPHHPRRGGPRRVHVGDARSPAIGRRRRHHAMAVEGFLAAEIAGDPDASFALLAAPARAKLVTLAAWRAAHTDLPVYRSSMVKAVSPDGSVVTDVDAPAAARSGGRRVPCERDDHVAAGRRGRWLAHRPVRHDGRAALPGRRRAPPSRTGLGAGPTGLRADPAAVAACCSTRTSPGRLCHEAGSFQAAAPRRCRPSPTLLPWSMPTAPRRDGLRTGGPAVRPDDPRGRDRAAAATWVVIGVGADLTGRSAGRAGAPARRAVCPAPNRTRRPALPARSREETE